MSEELIRRSDVIEALKDNMVEMGGEDFSEIGVHSDDIDAIINDIPSIEPKRGRWVWQSSMAGSFTERRYKCSNCQYEIATQREEPTYNFCPNCGASMREREGE